MDLSDSSDTTRSSTPANSEYDDAMSGISTHETPESHFFENTKDTSSVFMNVDTDLLASIKGAYRVLDLISEQGSGGLVEKIIIDQTSFKQLSDDFCPGAYSSLTKIDFKTLDRLQVKPIGVYGSREKITEFLCRIDAVNDATAHLLNIARSDAPGPSLRSGLYLVKSSNGAEVDTTTQIFVVYWPEDSTWDDNAIDSVRRNRITFMRYLTKITRQVVCLISQEHAAAMVWRDDTEELLTDELLTEDSDRLFTFEVSKTNEQEENVTLRRGFTVFSSRLSHPTVSAQLPAEHFLPRMLSGGNSAGFMTMTYVPGSTKEHVFDREHYSAFKLKDLLRNSEPGKLKLDENLGESAINALIANGLDHNFSAACREWEVSQQGIEENDRTMRQRKMTEAQAHLQSDKQETMNCLEVALAEMIVDTFPCLDFDMLVSDDLKPKSDASEASKDGSGDAESADHDRKPAIEEIRNVYKAKVSTLTQLHPKIDEELRVATGVNKLKFSLKSFARLKERILVTRFAMLHPEHFPLSPLELIQEDLSVQSLQAVFAKDKPKVSVFSAAFTKAMSFIRRDGQSSSILHNAKSKLMSTSDVEFLHSLQSILDEEPLFEPLVTATKQSAQQQLQTWIKKTVTTTLAHRVYQIQLDSIKLHVNLELGSIREQQQRINRGQFINAVNGGHRSDCSLVIDGIETVKPSWGGPDTFIVTGLRRTHVPEKIRYRIDVLRLKAEDLQELQKDHTFVPSPQVEDRFAHIFSLDVTFKILFCQLIGAEKCLLVIDDQRGNIFIYLESFDSLENAINRGSSAARRTVKRDKIGVDLLISYDDTKRMLLFCAASKLVLHIFQFEETYRTLQTWATAVELGSWYNYGSDVISILQAHIIYGGEEILLIDNTAQVRIYSLITQQFRPASLLLEHLPIAAFPTPDGACLILAYSADSTITLQAYHWSTFGSRLPITLDVPRSPQYPMSVTSMFTRNTIHLIGVDCDQHLCWSYALDIAKRVTEFQFKEKGVRALTAEAAKTTIHNCLIDCHSDVWTRFPVVAAIQRRIISSYANGPRKTLTFVTDRDHSQFAPHFAELIQNFEQTKRKPTGNELKSIHVTSTDFDGIIKHLTTSIPWDVTHFNFGEWLVDILCLIPIHIAITRDNRFIPLKDGVSSTDLEKSLLGAEVGHIIDSLSFGWYESIFQSYLALKPVKVVSSMGEQSVGKSYSLNHLVDSSFAGSAMRTTEGVWLSVTPTTDALIVALDFEGVHSIERSAQEDTLLVLFNTAVSNLVLFRNNFALSRDITGLFQSFQSSSAVFDPSVNPGLFQSRLVIIIKDVVDSDKNEIVKEFRGKFQKIVQDEQDANFISRLHAGKLSIIPWPVIESSQFYGLFPVLRKQLDQQPLTHPAAGEFLITVKTLMAKLKANDWGALSQTLVAHRAQRLLSMLVTALTHGLAEINPAPEHLKNFDTDVVIDVPDTDARFFLSSATSCYSDKDSALLALQSTWEGSLLRNQQNDYDWMTDLASHIAHLVDQRVEHVKTWIGANLSRFKTNHANIEVLRRTLDSLVAELKANTELCKLQCSECQLLCLKIRHDPDVAHNCQTSHQCEAHCEYESDHQGEDKGCGLPAGHAGKHICAVETHLCGQICGLANKKGCLRECTKVAGHIDEHVCSAAVHRCGEPCQLKNLKLKDASSESRTFKLYSCSGTCSVPSDREHTWHVCDDIQCPIPCEMCKRLCTNGDHLHGLEAGATHLCGQEHSCTALCTGKGICEIDTAPHSIEATFTGRHETFQYTKYSQVAKRLPCVIPIPSGELAHTGPHSHTTDENAFHFCETQCENCGYYCILPRGHPQKEHETSHGSMSRTRWSVEGPDGSVLELGGHRFGSNDDCAPVMCNLVCQDMGRHAHLDYCRSDDPSACSGQELEHIRDRLSPNPHRAKDWISHKIFWRRSGFKDPYSRDDQANFGKCDAMCPGPEHAAPNQPSYCTLRLFHRPKTSSDSVGLGYLSHDGHVFACKNPVVLQQAFHVIFVIDRSGSMTTTDRLPLPGTPATSTIASRSNNRLGAVYSALFGFWTSRHSAFNAGGQQVAGNRRDAYSIILFDHTIEHAITNDFTSAPQDLLNSVLRFQADGGTNFTLALQTAQSIMQQCWSTERSPVVIFLSDGECSVNDETVQDLCRAAIALGKPLSFHSVAFGPSSGVLRRMAHLALDIQNSAPVDPNTPPAARVDSSYSEALDTVRLAETFLGIADSLKKPRASFLK